MTANPDLLKWTDDFVSAQRGYWDLWSKLAQQSLQADPTTAKNAMGGWGDAFERWWSGLQIGLPRNEALPPLSSLAEQMRWFMQMSEGFTRSMSAYSALNEPTDQWQQHLNQAFEQFRQFMTPPAGGDWNDATRTLMDLGQQPLGAVMQSMSGVYAATADIMNGLKGEMPSVMGPLENETQRLLGIPALGYSRESQEEMQRAIQLHLAHQHAVNRFSLALSRLTSESMDHMLQKLTSMGQKSESVSSLRGLYDLWVDSSEEVFARYALTDEYSKLYADVVNTLMAFRLHAQAMVDDVLARMNLPTRRELDTQGQRMHALRRKVAELDSRLVAVPTPALDTDAERRIAVLEEELARLRERVDAAAADTSKTGSTTNPVSADKPATTSAARAALRKRDKS